MDTTGEWLRALRRKNRFTQEEMAQEIGVSVRTIARWEGGQSEPSPLATSRLRELFTGLEQQEGRTA